MDNRHVEPHTSKTIKGSSSGNHTVYEIWHREMLEIYNILPSRHGCQDVFRIGSIPIGGMGISTGYLGCLPYLPRYYFSSAILTYSSRGE